MNKLLPLAAVAALALPVATASAKPHAHIAKNCALTTAEQGGSSPSTLGPTYVIKDKFSASGTSCKKGKKLIKGFGHSSSNSYSKTVKGFHCTQHIEDKSPTEYSSTVTCKKGSATVKYLYVEFT